MAGPLTYLEFHARFLLAPLAVLAAAALWRYRLDQLRRRHVGVFLLVCLLAVGYTTPWDNYLIGLGVWSYGSGRVTTRLGHVPVGEYLFFVLQPALTTLWLAHLGNRVVPAVEQTRRDALGGFIAGVAIAVLGAVLFLGQRTTYLGAILAWAGPVLALQWAVGWRYLWRVRRRVTAAVLVPTAYLAVADAVALSRGVWTITPRFRTGLAVGIVPVEELLFFLVTNLFVVQALVLFPWVLAIVASSDLVGTDETTASHQRVLGLVRRWR